jgi:hypothetical protein
MNMIQKLGLKDTNLILNFQTLTLTYLGILFIYNSWELIIINRIQKLSLKN